MQFQELIEADKAALLEKLRQNAQLQKAVPVLEDECQRLLIRHNEAARSEVSAERAASAIRMIRYQLPLILSADQAKIWQSETGGTPGTKKENGSGVWLVLFLVGVFFMLGALLVPAAMDQQVLMHLNMKIVLIMLAAAAGLFLAACLLRGTNLRNMLKFKKESKNHSVKEQYVEVLIDPEKTYSTLRTMMVALDKEIEDAERALYRITAGAKLSIGTGAGTGAGSSMYAGTGAGTGPASSTYAGTGTGVAAANAISGGNNGSRAALSEDELELFAGLLEAETSGDSGYALDQIGNVRFYLHRQGIETVDYTQEHDSWFERMPAAPGAGGVGLFADRSVKTVRPALVRNGELVKKGIAAG